MLHTRSSLLRHVEAPRPYSSQTTPGAGMCWHSRRFFFGGAGGVIAFMVSIFSVRFSLTGIGFAHGDVLMR